MDGGRKPDSGLERVTLEDRVCSKVYQGPTIKRCRRVFHSPDTDCGGGSRESSNKYGFLARGGRSTDRVLNGLCVVGCFRDRVRFSQDGFSLFYCRKKRYEVELNEKKILFREPFHIDTKGRRTPHLRTRTLGRTYAKTHSVTFFEDFDSPVRSLRFQFKRDRSRLATTQFGSGRPTNE